MAWQDMHRAARKILPFEEDEAPYRRNHSPAGGRILRGMCSLGPTAVSASSISRFLGLGESSSGPRCASTDIGYRPLDHFCRRPGLAFPRSLPGLVHGLKL